MVYLTGGSLSLSSNDPFQQPLIETGFLTSDFDIMALREGLKLAMKFVTAPVWKNYILELVTPGLANATTVADVDDFLRSVAGSAYHFSGTAAMTAPDAGYGVVNPDLRVKGVKGLRIIDASVFVS